MRLTDLLSLSVRVDFRVFVAQLKHAHLGNISLKEVFISCISVHSYFSHHVSVHCSVQRGCGASL